MKDLTIKYSLHQFFYWAASAGVVSFAAAYLLENGFNTAQIGLILFLAYVASFLLQPVIGSAADKINKNILPHLVIKLEEISCICFLSVFFIKMPMLVFSVVYLIGVLCIDMQMSLMNSINVYYIGIGYKINYGLSRGVGGLGYAIATLGFGYLMEYVGAEYMPPVSVFLSMLCILTVSTYPKYTELSAAESDKSREAPVSVFKFAVKYKWYCVSLIGILLFAVFHVMTENYLIEIFKNLGGDSSNVGIALFAATITELPAMNLYPALRKKFGTRRMLVIGSSAYILKSILLIAASSAFTIYFIQLLQCISYVPVSMSQMYYAEHCTDKSDMIKGQSMITAFYTLGCAVGNLLGGVVIASLGVRQMLYLGLAITLLGALSFAVTLPRTLKKI